MTRCTSSPPQQGALKADFSGSEDKSSPCTSRGHSGQGHLGEGGKSFGFRSCYTVHNPHRKYTAKWRSHYLGDQNRHTAGTLPRRPSWICNIRGWHVYQNNIPGLSDHGDRVQVMREGHGYVVVDSSVYRGSLGSSWSE